MKKILLSCTVGGLIITTNLSALISVEEAYKEVSSSCDFCKDIQITNLKHIVSSDKESLPKTIVDFKTKIYSLPHVGTFNVYYKDGKYYRDKKEGINLQTGN
jgi:hypothetical protein